MRDRLIELLNQRTERCLEDGCRKDCAWYRKGDKCKDYASADHLLANGVIVPPCKIGDTVWFELYGQIESAVIYHCTYESSHRGFILSGAYAKDTRGLELCFDQNSIGKAVFLTREEAEQVLKGGESDG